MDNIKLTPELIKKAKEAKSVEDLKKIAENENLNYSDEQINKFANYLGLLDKVKLDDNSIDKISGGRSTVNGQDVECMDSRVCKRLGIEYQPGWGKSTDSDGNEIWQVPYNIYEEALKDKN